MQLPFGPRKRRARASRCTEAPLSPARKRTRASRCAEASLSLNLNTVWLAREPKTPPQERRFRFCSGDRMFFVRTALEHVVEFELRDLCASGRSRNVTTCFGERIRVRKNFRFPAWIHISRRRIQAAWCAEHNHRSCSPLSYRSASSSLSGDQKLCGLQHPLPRGQTGLTPCH
jgi:hypothetical protein